MKYVMEIARIVKRFAMLQIPNDTLLKVGLLCAMASYLPPKLMPGGCDMWMWKTAAFLVVWKVDVLLWLVAMGICLLQFVRIKW